MWTAKLMAARWGKMLFPRPHKRVINRVIRRYQTISWWLRSYQDSWLELQAESRSYVFWAKKELQERGMILTPRFEVSISTIRKWMDLLKEAEWGREVAEAIWPPRLAEWLNFVLYDADGVGQWVLRWVSVSRPHDILLVLWDGPELDASHVRGVSGLGPDALGDLSLPSLFAGQFWIENASEVMRKWFPRRPLRIRDK